LPVIVTRLFSRSISYRSIPVHQLGPVPPGFLATWQFAESVTDGIDTLSISVA
jgi:hypothetical protein